MAVTPRLELRQSQSLVMTPQLQQAIKLLQLSNLELAAYVEQEIEQNPLLEREDGGGEPEQGGETEHSASEVEPDGNGAAEPQLLDRGRRPRQGCDETPLDTDFGNVWSERRAATATHVRRLARQRRARGLRRSEVGLDQTLSRDVSLRDHLLGAAQCRAARSRRPHHRQCI